MDYEFRDGIVEMPIKDGVMWGDRMVQHIGGHAVGHQYACKCGGTEFTVFGGDYSTVLKCAACGAGFCVHEG